MNTQKNDKIKSDIKDWLKTLIIFVVVFVGFRFLVGLPVIVNGESMAPTLVHGDSIFVEKFSYLFTSPDRNDVIVFPYSKDPSKEYIKRIIGLPGDEIDLKDNNIYINGELFDDPYKSDNLSLGTTEFPLIVGENEYFVMGDNRAVSHDSRHKEVGLINESDIEGRAFFIFNPFNRIKFIK